jgi:hypothetical protein
VGFRALLQGKKKRRQSVLLKIPFQGSQGMNRIAESLGCFFRGKLFDNQGSQGFIPPLHGILGLKEEVFGKQEEPPFDII